MDLEFLKGLKVYFHLFKVIWQSLNHFFNPSEVHWNFIVDASIQWPGYMLQVMKRWHLLWNFRECLKECDHDLMMDDYLKANFVQGFLQGSRWHNSEIKMHILCSLILIYAILQVMPLAYSQQKLWVIYIRPSTCGLNTTNGVPSR